VKMMLFTIDPTAYSSPWELATSLVLIASSSASTSFVGVGLLAAVNRDATVPFSTPPAAGPFFYSGLFQACAICKNLNDVDLDSLSSSGNTSSHSSHQNDQSCCPHD